MEISGRRKKLVGERFEDEVVELDANVFEDCTFVSCVLIYRGGSLPTFQGETNFMNCTFKFEDAASNALRMLSILYNSGATDVVEGAFEAIKRGGV